MVDIWNCSSGSTVSAVTGSSGEYSAAVSSGRLGISFSQGVNNRGVSSPGLPGKWNFGTYDCNQTPFNVVSDKTLNNVVLPPVTKVKVHVQDSSGAPIVGARALDTGGWLRSNDIPVSGNLNFTAGSSPFNWCFISPCQSTASDADGNIYLTTFGFGNNGYSVDVEYVTASGAKFTQKRLIDGRLSSPQNLRHSNLTESSVVLDWDAVFDKWGLGVYGYSIQYSEDGQNWSTIPQSVQSSNGATIANLTKGRVYFFRVAAINVVGVGDYSAELRIQTPGNISLTAPSRLSISSVKTSSASLSWPAVIASAKVSNYLVDVSTDGTSWIPVSKKVSTSTMLSLSGLKLGTTYQARVAAVNSVGTGAYVYGSFTTLATVSTAPTALVGSNLSSSGFTLNWNAPSSNGGAAITDYVVEINGGGFSWSPISHDITGNNSITVTGLNPGIKYSVRVKAVNRVGMSKTSTSLYVTTLATAPGTVAALTVKSVTATSAAITWTAPNAGGAKISDYLAEYSTDNGQSWKTVVKSASSSTSLTLKGLKTKTSYLIRITAKNSVGYGSVSQSLTVVTP